MQSLNAYIQVDFLTLSVPELKLFTYGGKSEI